MNTPSKNSKYHHSIWAIADLHLSFGVPDKAMDVFGEEWANWTERLEASWKKNISEEDLVLIPGDLSWAMHLEDAIPDFEWVDRLPGTKVLIRGNHDYWWSSKSKIQKVLPSSIHIIQNDSFLWKNVSIGGARLWDTSEYNFNDYTILKENPKARELTDVELDAEKAEKIFIRELHRLELSLKSMDKEAELRIVMTHYPPIGADLAPSRASLLLEKYDIDICVFGHLHSLKPSSLPFGEKNGVRYVLCSCDYLNFQPIHLK